MGLKSGRDLLVVLLGTALTFALTSAFELQERLHGLMLRFEAWQLDEMPLTLTALSLGLAWYGWRRQRDTAELLAHNRELARHMLKVQESERLALARELHDDLAQHCTAIRVEAACIQRSRDPGQIALAASRVGDAAEALHSSVRGLLRRLRPAELDELGLVAALQSLCRTWQARSGVACEFVFDRSAAPLNEAINTAVYRVAQEALVNVTRHAQATGVRIALQASGTTLTLEVQDDGCGFDAARATRGLGLLGAAERAAALGGRIDMDSAPGQGARLRMALPL
jgi:two-component system sensor histidine kinase UhpB